MFCDEELLISHPIPMLENRPLSTVCYRLSNSYIRSHPLYRGAGKSLARTDWRKQLKGRHFSSDAEVIAAAETWLGGQPSDFFFGLQKLEFGSCSLFPSWSG